MKWRGHKEESRAQGPCGVRAAEREVEGSGTKRKTKAAKLMQCEHRVVIELAEPRVRHTRINHSGRAIPVWLLLTAYELDILHMTHILLYCFVCLLTNICLRFCATVSDVLYAA